MLKHSPKHFNDDPTVNLPTQHGQFNRAQVFRRVAQVPKDSCVAKEQELYARALWNPTRSLRLLELARLPSLTLWEIAQMLRKEFNDHRFTKGALAGRLDRLRNISKGFYAKNYLKRIPSR